MIRNPIRGSLLGVPWLVCSALSAAAAPPAYDHVVLVVEENHSYPQITGTYASSAPYINGTLIAEGASFTSAYGEEHASEGNYHWLFSGSNHGIGFGDPCPVGPFSSPNLGASLIGAGRSFKGYSEDLPAIGSTVCGSGGYARKHNPWVNFSNVPNGTTVATSSNLRYVDFPSDYSTLPTVSIVMPNQNNDMHNGSNPTTVATGDTWLRTRLDGYYQWAKTHNSVLIITFDEDGVGAAGLTNPGVGANHIVTVIAGAGIAHGGYAEGAGITHVNMLRTLEDMYGLPHAGAQQSLATAAGIGNGPINDIYTQWNVDADGDWFAASNWNQNAVPSGIGAVANFLGSIYAPRATNLDYPATVSVMNFDNVNGYRIIGTNTLTLDAPGGFAPSVNVASGSHSIETPLVLATNANFNVGYGASLTASNLAPSTVAVTKTGTGVLAANRLQASSLQIAAGAVAILPNGSDSGVSRVGALAIAGGAAPTAALDLADNAMVIDYDDSSPISATGEFIAAGYNYGSWTGNGLTSSSAQTAAPTTTKTAVGIAEASDLFTNFPAIFNGQSVDSTTVLVAYTLAGDANLDKAVSSADFNLLAISFGTKGDRWSQGDFNYDGLVDSTDFNLLASNFGKTLTSGLGASVPEPGALAGMAALLAMSLVRHRKR